MAKKTEPKKLSAVVAAALTCFLILSGCGTVPNEAALPQEKAPSEEELAQAAYADFLAGEETLIDDAQVDMWWIPDFRDGSLKYEYTYLDLNGDGISELIVQMEGDPAGYNGVFHFEDGRITCWNSDGVEMSSRSQPLDSGEMVREYEYNGTRSYTVFRYQGNGETEDISSFFAREELIPEDSTEPCPYYEIDGKEVDRDEFDERFGERVTGRLLDRSLWTEVLPAD